MAIEQHAREDLFEEAIAYRRRLLFRSMAAPTAAEASSSAGTHHAGEGRRKGVGSEKCEAPGGPLRLLTPDPIHAAAGRISELFMGRRENGAWSIYFDEDPVLQFTPQGELRRLFFGGERLVAVRGRLAVLHRENVGGRMRFEPRPLTPERQEKLIDTCVTCATLAGSMLQTQALMLAKTYPAGDDALRREAAELLASIALGFPIAQSSGV